MKVILFTILTLVVLLIVGGGLIYASPRSTPVVSQVAVHQSQPTTLSTTTGPTTPDASISQSFVDEVQNGIPFHVLFPADLQQRYTLSANLNVVHYHGGVTYSIDASGTPFITVTERSAGDQNVNMFSTSEMQQGGSVTSTELGGSSAYLGIITKGFAPGHQLTVLVFTRAGVDVQFSTFTAVEPPILVQLAETME